MFRLLKCGNQGFVHNTHLTSLTYSAIMTSVSHHFNMLVFLRQLLQCTLRKPHLVIIQLLITCPWSKFLGEITVWRQFAEYVFI